jgi:predicted transposase YbfD/YdcC
MTTTPTATPLSLRRFFGRLRDPRRHHLKRHLLLDIVGITLCAVIAGANDWQQIATFAQHRRDWLATFLALPNGIPSHDTLERVFDLLDPSAFQACFQRWVDALAGALGLGHIAIDGKTLRGSGNGPKGWKCLHLVSAWAGQCHLSLGQVAVEDKSNEITAIPRLLELLDLHGALVTLDAMGCQKEIARKIIDGGGDYVLTVKDNHPHLLDDIQNKIADVLDGKARVGKHEQWASEGRGHGRREKRSYLIITDLEGIRDRQQWKGLKVIGMCVSECVRNGKCSEEVRYFIGSREMRAQEYGEALRNHWGIENNLHWQLDITLREDSNRVQRRHGAENLALVRRLAVSLLKRHPGKDSLARKRYAAALNTAFLEEILAAGCKPEKQ